jgi:hypothetical protein
LVLEQIVPGASAELPPPGRLGVWPRLFLRDNGALQYAFLLPVGGSSVELHVYPGDTLTQAQILFKNQTKPDALLRLHSRGWKMRANFHFGAQQSGQAWQTATAPADRYIDWCLAFAPRAGALEPSEWDALLDELQRRGFASPGDKEKFYAAFASRKTAVPRPGLHLWRMFEASLDDEHALVQEVRAELGAILWALTEPLGELGSVSRGTGQHD